MNEIVIKIEGLKELTEALQALAGKQTAQTTPEAQNAQPAVQAAPIQPPMQAPAMQPQMAYNVPMQQSVVPLQAPMIPVQQAPMSAPIQPLMQAPVQQDTSAPVQQAPQPVPTAPTAVPTNAAPQQYSFDQLAVALSNVCSKPGGQPQVHGLLQQFGVQALFDLPKEKYGEFATALRGIGGVL